MEEGEPVTVTTVNPTFVSPAVDHELAHRYASYLAGRGKGYGNSYGGARWELAFARCCGPTVFNPCVAHLVRAVKQEETADDWDWDVDVNGVHVDLKAAERGLRALTSSLLLDEGKPRAGVAYVLAEHDRCWPDRLTPPYDMLFTFRGWTFGEAGVFAPALWVGRPGVLHATDLGDWASLAKLLGL